MSKAKLYTAIYVVLFVLATVQVVVEQMGYLEAAYWPAFTAIIVLSALKAVFVAGWYQHLRYEPRSVTTLILLGLLGAVALTVAASYSIL
ncbi:cytochrome C oxidase subunit IV family protein [Haloarchaeobius sp. HRN-SO-5]|uniref:cytochrome C oxidase subunit IV family protein n=1 Tax=Haloarchaeobius sp. HRN-SO-5 TaxID=3446118 RepID=UPI003EB9F25F